MNRILYISSAIVLLIPLLAGCSGEAEKEIITGKSILVQSAIVVSAHPQASLAGAGILKKGGNAVDAAIATEFALSVCYPAAGNIGGGGLMVVRLNDGQAAGLDYREKAPGKAHRDLFLDGEENVVPGLSTRSHLASGVPGTVAGMAEAHTRYGSLSFEELVQPAIDLAADGFPVTAAQAESLNRMNKTFRERNRSAVAFVRRDGQWKEGDTLVQTDLAETLKLIRDNGADGFYSGPVAGMIVNEMSIGGGIITLDDLSEYRAVWRDPVRGSYGEYDIISMAPPSSGGIALLQLFGMIEDFPVKEWGFHSVPSVHLMVEAERRVYADRAEYLGDPDFVEIPVDILTSKDYLTGRMFLFDDEMATPSEAIDPGDLSPYESEETTHYSVVDSHGNSVSATTTLNSSYGSGIVVSGAGFLLNNEMDDFSVKPGYPNIYGLVGGEANSVAPGKRMLSSMTPTIVEKNSSLYMVVGSPGGSTIITSVFQTILNVTAFGMTIKEAVDAPRFHHQWLPDEIAAEEDAFSPEVERRLEMMGHTIKRRSSIGRVEGIRVTEQGMLEGGADKRGDDCAAGF
ncbi:MAG: gamma-glutamyltransferase [Bacteroidales bacterium]|nr:gamma-glutamyltransferase [Bacteroidales bacterium]